MNNNHRPIDKLLKQNFSTLTRQVKLVRKVKIKTWQALGMITFLAGFAAAFVWGLSDGWYSKLYSAPSKDQVSNQAQLTFEDGEGNQYGPVTSNVVTTEIVQAQPQPSAKFDYVLCQAGSTGQVDCPIYPIPNIPKPEKGVPFEDPTFHTTITRITDKDIDGFTSPPYTYYGWTSLEYSTSPFENSDGSYILLCGGKWPGWWIYDAKTFKLIKGLNFPTDGEIAEPRWDAKDPNVFYFRYRMGFYKHDVSTDKYTLIRDFSAEYPEGTVLYNDDEGDASLDRRYWAFLVRTGGPEYRKFAALVYDKETDTIVGRLDDLTDYPVPNWISMSASGERVVLPGHYYPTGHGIVSFKRDFTDEVHLTNQDPIPHSDLAIDADGNEVFVFQDNRTDWISMADLRTGEVTKLVKIDFSKGSIGFHFSGNNVKRPGWIMVNACGRPGIWMDESFFMLELKENPRIWRIAHRHSPEAGYWGNAIASITTDGLTHYFASNWDNPGGPIEVYQISLPETWWEDLSAGVIPQPQTCQDNTPYNQCSNNKPQYCQNGTLIDNCSVCGCPGNKVCQADGSCLALGQVQSEPFDINYKKQGRNDYTGPVIIRIYEPGTDNLVATINTNANSQGQAQNVKHTEKIPDGVYDLVIKIPGYLTRRLSNIIWPPTQPLDFGECKAGNLNDSDNVINSLDWSVMNFNWGTSNETADINGDGIVNTLDWSLINRNWGLSGE